MKASPVKIQDVAKAAGVSIATVSYVMNGTGRVSAATAEKVRKVIEELDYKPSQSAINFKNQKTKTIGWVLVLNQIPDAGEFWAPIIANIMYRATMDSHKRGYSMVLIPHDSPEMMKKLNVDGVVLSDNFVNDQNITYANSLGIPILTNEWFDDPKVAVNMDFGYRDMTIAALDLLKQKGAKRIGLLTEQADFSSNYQSEKVYLNWCKDQNQNPVVVRGSYNRSDIAECVKKLIEQKVDAIYSFYEEGPEILAELNKLGISVPDDLLLIANVAYSDDANKSLGITSTVHYPDSMLTEATNALIDIIEGKQNSPITIKVPWELNEYESTK